MANVNMRPVIITPEDTSFPTYMKVDLPPPYAVASQKEDNGANNKPCYKRIFSCCQNTCKWHPLLPSWTLVSRFLTLLILGLMIWGSAFSKLGPIAAPDGQLFKLAFLGASSYIAGHIAALFGLPNILGMLLTGILFRNIGFIVFTGPFLHVANAVREVALFIILTRSGLELDPVALKKLYGMVTGIVIVPAIVEAIAIAVATYFLMDLPWLWGFLLGSVMAAVSPAIIIPCIINLQALGNYGKNKGIPTLLIAATSFDDVLCITAFSVILGIITSTGNITTHLIHGPVAVVIGLVSGIALGMLLRYLPHDKDRRLSMLRTLLLVGGGLLLMFGSIQIGYEVAGPLGCVISAFVSCNGWKPSEKKAVEDNIGIMWEFVLPILFGLIGNEINFHVLQVNMVGMGVVSLLLALVARMFASIMVSVGGDFNWKERIFVSVTWIAKATVQAALGPVALARVRELNLEEMVPYAEIILTISVLSILIAAPMGGILMTYLGPKLLKKEEEPQITTGQHSAVHI